MDYRILMRITSQSSKPKGMEKHEGYCQFIKLSEFLYFLQVTFAGVRSTSPLPKKQINLTSTEFW